MAFETTHACDMEILDSVAHERWTWAHLFQNNFTPTKSSEAADFTEADFSGYSAKQQFWPNNSFLNGTPRAQRTGSSIQWIMTGGDVGNTIYGVYWVDDNGAVMGFMKFDTPIVVDTEDVSTVEVHLGATCDNP